MVQMRVITRRDGIEQALRDVGPAIDRMKTLLLEDMAQQIAETSPVDSGEYVKNHQVRLRSGSFRPNKPRSDKLPRISKGDPVNAQAARAEGLQNMLSDIASINIKSENFVFRNPMLYSRIVEGNRAVYAQARASAAAMIREVVARSRF